MEADFRDVRTDANTVPRGQNRYLRYGPRGPLQINLQVTREGDLDIRSMELLFQSLLQIEETVSRIKAVKNPTLGTLPS